MAAKRWRFIKTVDTEHGSIEIYTVDGTELRYGRHWALVQYCKTRQAKWKTEQTKKELLGSE